MRAIGNGEEDKRAARRHILTIIRPHAWSEAKNFHYF
jgi:hypothetical protein